VSVAESGAPADGVKRDRIFWWALLALEVFFCVVILGDLSSYTIDDGYIYLNGARQLARGELPNMTPGESPTNSWGSYLWLLMLTPAYLLGVNPLFWAKALGFLFLLGGVWWISLLFRCWRPRMSRLESLALSGLLLAFIPAVYGSVNVLETGFHLFAILMALYFLVRDVARKRPGLTFGLALSLLCVSRPDAFIEVVLFLAAYLWLSFRRESPFTRRDVWRPLPGLVPGLLFWAAIASIYGSLLPTSAMAKAPELSFIFSFEWLNHFDTAVVELAYTPVLPLALAGAAVFLFGRKKNSPLPPVRFLLAAILLLGLAKMLILMDWTMLNRLWLGGATIAIVCSIVLVYDLVEAVRSRFLVSLAFCIGLMGGLWGWRFNVFNYFIKTRCPAREMGELINDLKLPGSWLAMADMGVVPYRADIPTIDTEKHPVCNQYLLDHPMDMDYIWKHQVDFVVLVSIYLNPVETESIYYGIPYDIYSSEYFKEHFRPVMVAETSVPLTLDYYCENLAHYFHLYVSDRIHYDAPDPVPVHLRGLAALPTDYPYLNLVIGDWMH
jgi:hypothetical protein